MKKTNYDKINKKLAAETYKYIVVIGTSTGGPNALSQVISALPKELPATYIVVQHMPAGFTKSLAERLDKLSSLEVKEAEAGEHLEQGTVYIAPGGKQLRIKNSLKPEIELSNEEAYKGHKPSVNVMFSSVADLVHSKKVIGIIMTGMGKDGLEGVMDLRKHVDISIIAEAESTCVVYGMPKAIVNEGLSDYQLPLHEIAEKLIKIMGE